jgi:hypothetical protein
MNSRKNWDLSFRPDERQEWRSRISHLYDQGRWIDAYREAKKMSRTFPNSVEAILTAAAIRGDAAETLLGSGRRQGKHAAIKVLKIWVKSPPIKLPRVMSNYAWNEFYYHSGQFKRQALLGMSEIRDGEPYAAYSVGVGAAFYAAELCRYHQYGRARYWASISVEAWSDYFRLPQKRKRFDTYTFLAVALSVLGQNEEAEKELGIVKDLLGFDIRETPIYDVRERLLWCKRIRAKYNDK